MEKETIGSENRTGFIFHPLDLYFLSRIQEFSLKSDINRKEELKIRFEKRVIEAGISNSKTYTSLNKMSSSNLDSKIHI